MENGREIMAEKDASTDDATFVIVLCIAVTVIGLIAANVFAH